MDNKKLIDAIKKARSAANAEGAEGRPFEMPQRWDILYTFHTDSGRDIFYKSSINLEQYGQVMIGLHGFGGSMESPLITALANERPKIREVIAFDWPAHGNSTAPDSDFTVENCLKDLHSIVEMVREKYPDKTLSCFATSFGAYIGTLYRNAHPDTFEQFIMRSPALKMDKVLKNMLSDEYLERIKRGETVEMGFNRKIQIGKPFLDSVLAHPVYDEPVPDPMNVMVFQGSKDTVVDPEDTVAYAKKNHILVNIFPDSDHWYKGDDDYERIIENVKEFFSIQYSANTDGDVYRVIDGWTLDVWDKELGAWQIVENRKDFIIDSIEGRAGIWDEYINIDSGEAWEVVKNLGGTLDEFIKMR